MPIIEAIAAIEPNTAALPIEKSLPNDDIAAAKITYASKLKITYKFASDGSIVLRSLIGISLKTFKRLSDKELEAIGLYREEIGLSTKYWEIQEDRRESKAIVLTGDKKQVSKKDLLDAQPIIEAIAATVDLADKRFTLKEAAEYYSAKSGKPLGETLLKANAKKYGFSILEKGSGLYALIES